MRHHRSRKCLTYLVCGGPVLTTHLQLVHALPHLPCLRGSYPHISPSTGTHFTSLTLFVGGPVLISHLQLVHTLPHSPCLRGSCPHISPSTGTHFTSLTLFERVLSSYSIFSRYTEYHISCFSLSCPYIPDVSVLNWCI